MPPSAARDTLTLRAFDVRAIAPADREAPGRQRRLGVSVEVVGGPAIGRQGTVVDFEPMTDMVTLALDPA
jgi:hypothetical protein